MPDARLDPTQVTRLYRRLASGYDLWAGLTESRARERCIEAAAIRDGDSVLEVAVGTGLAFERILARSPSGRVEGVDLTDAMLERARARASRTGHSNYRLRLGDARSLDFPDDRFDVLINMYMFDLLPERDFRPVLAEFRRILQPGGRLALVNMTDGERWYNGIWERIYRMNPAWLGGCRAVRLSPALEDSGFVDIRRQYVSQMTFPSEVIRATAP